MLKHRSASSMVAWFLSEGIAAGSSALSVKTPVPVFVTVAPAPVNAPLKVEVALLFPSVKAKLLGNARVPGPLNPPKVAAPLKPAVKFKVPGRVVSNVLFWSASALFN